MSSTILTVDHVAQQLKLHPKTVLRHIREGRLRATRIGKSYRIAQADFNAFAGQAAPASGGIRVTCTVDLPGISADAMYRIDVFLGAAARSGDSGRSPLHASTAFDPATRTLKIVLVGTPGDVAGVLGFFHAQQGEFS